MFFLPTVLPKSVATNAYAQFSTYYTYQPKTYQPQEAFRTHNYHPHTPYQY